MIFACNPLSDDEQIVGNSLEKMVGEWGREVNAIKDDCSVKFLK